jgi:hypothetical protein
VIWRSIAWWVFQTDSGHRAWLWSCLLFDGSRQTFWAKVLQTRRVQVCECIAPDDKQPLPVKMYLTCPGETCSLWLQAGILRIARDVASGMAYLHSLSICHGDLKCENVLLARGVPEPVQPVQQDAVTAKISDFGLSRAMGSAVSHLSTNTVGTVTHMPPELLCSGQLRPAADVYSFGIMLWQVRQGRC